MEKVTIKSLNSANLRMDNSVDADREYNIAANVNIDSGSVVNSIDSGNVIKEGIEIATFNAYSDNNLQINFNNVAASEQCTIITSVNAFIADVRTKAANGNMLSNINSI